jgi:hypothetical protein
LADYKYPRTALLLSKKYQKEALCEAHNSIFGGHDANLKTYMKISSSYYWPGLFRDVKTHISLPHLSAKKTFQPQAKTVAASANSGTTKLENSR